MLELGGREGEEEEKKGFISLERLERLEQVYSIDAQRRFVSL
jgi:hypothetical protein